MIKFVQQPAVSYVQQLLAALEKMTTTEEIRGSHERIWVDLAPSGVIFRTSDLTKRAIVYTFGAVSVDYSFKEGDHQGKLQSTTTGKVEETALAIFNYFNEATPNA